MCLHQHGAHPRCAAQARARPPAGGARGGGREERGRGGVLPGAGRPGHRRGPHCARRRRRQRRGRRGRGRRGRRAAVPGARPRRGAGALGRSLAATRLPDAGAPCLRAWQVREGAAPQEVPQRPLSQALLDARGVFVLVTGARQRSSSW